MVTAGGTDRSGTPRWDGDASGRWGRRSRCVGRAGVEVQMDDRSVSAIVPGDRQACYGVISADQVANASTRNAGLDLMDASVAYWC